MLSLDLTLCLQVLFLKGCSNEPPLNTLSGNKVKLHQVQCSNKQFELFESFESYEFIVVLFIGLMVCV